MPLEIRWNDNLGEIVLLTLVTLSFCPPVQ